MLPNLFFTDKESPSPNVERKEWESIYSELYTVKDTRLPIYSQAEILDKVRNKLHIVDA